MTEAHFIQADSTMSLILSLYRRTSWIAQEVAAKAANGGKQVRATRYITIMVPRIKQRFAD